jgi:hypothetical protein
MNDLTATLLPYLGNEWTCDASTLVQALARINYQTNGSIYTTLESLLKRLHEQEIVTKRLQQENKSLVGAITRIKSPKKEIKKIKEIDKVIRTHTLQTTKIIDTSTFMNQHRHSHSIARTKFVSPESRRMSASGMHNYKPHTPLYKPDGGERSPISNKYSKRNSLHHRLPTHLVPCV